MSLSSLRLSCVLENMFLIFSLLCIVQLLNVNENKRFKKGGARFLGCYPVYNYDAAIGSQDVKRARALQLHHECSRALSKELREFCMRSHAMQTGDGIWYDCVPRLAFLATDYQQARQHLAFSGSGCELCMCPFEELDRPGNNFPIRNFKDVLESLQRLADECLDDRGNIIYGKKKVIEAWQREHRMKFIDNGFTCLMDVDFDVIMGVPRDFLHFVLLGLFGEHIVDSSVHKVTESVGNEAYRQSALMNDEKMNMIWNRLAERMSQVTESESALTITVKMSKHFLKVYQHGAFKFTGARMHAVMLAIPFLLRGLIYEEVT